jgi:hypothetical protein
MPKAPSAIPKTRIEVVDEIDEYVRKRYPELTVIERAEVYLTLATVEYDRTSSKIAGSAIAFIKRLMS